MKPLRVGILDLGGPLWSGVQAFARLLEVSLTGMPGIEPVWLSWRGDAAAQGQTCLPVVDLSLLARQPRRVARLVRRLRRQPAADALTEAVMGNEIDVVLPLTDPKRPLPCGSIGWIPDFQYRFLTEFYNEAQIRGSEAAVARVAEFSDRILFSSRDAQGVFAEMHPALADRCQALHFPSLMALQSAPQREALDVRKKYALPEKYLFVPNQFWRHKNHRVVVQALSFLKKGGRAVSCVFSGLPFDVRDSEGRHLSGILQEISKANVRDEAIVLGFVPREDVVALLRAATLVLQPSLFEGWSTSIQDALAMGRPVLCSDIPIHREQAGSRALEFFPASDPEVLATSVRSHWDSLPTGPDEAAEIRAVAAEKQAFGEYREALVGLVRAAADHAAARR